MKIKTIIMIFLLILIGSKGICADKITVVLRNDLPPFSFLNFDGQPTGFYVAMWNLWAKKTGQELEFRALTWKDTLESLEKRTADIHGALYYSEERAQRIAFSQPIYEISQCVFFPRNHKKIQNITELKGQKTGVTKGSAHEQELRKKYPEIEVVPFTTIEDMIHAVREGKIRAFVSTSASVLVILGKLGLAGEFESTDETLFTRKIYAGVLKENTELIALVDKGFEAISNKDLAEIEELWIADPEKRYFASKISMIKLSAEEKAWIQKHPSVKLGFTTTFPPFSFIGEKNVPTGMAFDYLEILRKSTGIDFQITESGNNEKIYSLLKFKQIDGTPYSVKTPEREQHLNYTRPYMINNWVIVTRNDYPFIGSIQDLKGKKVGVIKNSSAWEFAQKQTEIRLIPTDSQKDLWESLSFGKTEAVVQNISTAGYFISKLGITNLKVAYTFTEKLEVGLAMRKDMPELVNILNKAIDLIPPEQHATIQKKWMSLRYEQGVNWQILIWSILIISVIFLSVLLTTIIWNRRLAEEIAERKRAEAALHESESLYRRLHESMWDCFVQVNMAGNIVSTNNSYNKMLGYTQEEVLKLRYQDITPERWHQMEQHLVESQIIPNGYSDIYEKEYIRKDGSVFPVELRTYLLIDKNNQPEGMWAIVRDMTKRKRLEEERLELERRLFNMQKFESLIRISSGIAHNFNNILFGVTGNIEMAVYNLDPESPACRNLDNALKSAKRAAELTRKILAYSGSGFFTFKELNINRLIEENTDAFKSAMSENVSFNLNLTEDIPLINADPEQINRLIMNILVNASEAVREDTGKVTLSTGVMDCYYDSQGNEFQRIDDPEEKKVSGLCVYIEISDTGCGMDKEAVKLLTDPFFTTKFMGRGLGMSEVQGIVNTHKGAILVKSELDKGTTIRVMFPVSESASKITDQNTVHKEISHTDLLSKLVFVVDDEETVRNVCEIMLEHLGYRTLLANDGDEAVEIFRKHADDIYCVLLDLTMSKKDGISALKEMRHIRADVRVIISSGHSKEEISERFKDYGFAGILQKPFCLNDLKNELEALVKPLD